MTEPIVYGYLDLAERGSGMRYVLTSTGTTVGLNEDQWRRVDRDGETMLCNCDIVYVRGALALEVAEREVREAANKWKRRMRTVSCVAKDRTLDGEDAVFIRYGDKEVEDGAYRASVYPELARAVDLRDRLRAKLAGPAHHAVGTGNVGFAVEYARRSRICRLCGLPPERGPGLPFVYDFGRECAHERCLKRECYLHPLQASDPQQYIDKEDKPMPAKADPHDKCRVHIVNGNLVDDYGREIDCDSDWECKRRSGLVRERWVSMHVPLSDVPPDGATRPASRDVDPIYIESDKPFPLSERQRIASEVQEKTGRPVVMLPYGLHRGAAPVEPEEQQRLADISRRADLAAASRKAWRAGLIVGAIAGTVLACAAFLIDVARIKRQHAVQPATEHHDEHARESEDARARASGDGEEGR